MILNLSAQPIKLLQVAIVHISKHINTDAAAKKIDAGDGHAENKELVNVGLILSLFAATGNDTLYIPVYLQ